MNFIDYIIIVILFLSLLGGYKNGLIAELASIAALILGIWGAIHFSQITTEQLIRYFKLQTEYLDIISFGVTFLIIVILVHIVADVVSKMVEPGLLGVFNKMGGVIVGMLRSLLFLSIMLMIFDRIDNDMHFIPEKAKKESRMYESIRNLAPSIFPFIDLWDEQKSEDKDEQAAEQI
jgi:membrane protein required for colicin V production